jgi:beta-lactamase regulating signal transducer with metallopeptidase domain
MNFIPRILQIVALIAVCVKILILLDLKWVIAVLIVSVVIEIAIYLFQKDSKEVELSENETCNGNRPRS